MSSEIRARSCITIILLIMVANGQYVTMLQSEIIALEMENKALNAKVREMELMSRLQQSAEHISRVRRWLKHCDKDISEHMDLAAMTDDLIAQLNTYFSEIRVKNAESLQQEQVIRDLRAKLNAKDGALQQRDMEIEKLKREVSRLYLDIAVKAGRCMQCKEQSRNNIRNLWKDIRQRP